MAYTFGYTHQAAKRAPAELTAVFVGKGDLAAVKSVLGQATTSFSAFATIEKFKGTVGSACAFPHADGVLLAVGTGETKSRTMDAWRQAGGAIGKRLKHLQLTRVEVMLPTVAKSSDREMIWQAILEGVHLALYVFHGYKGSVAKAASENPEASTEQRVTFVAPDARQLTTLTSYARDVQASCEGVFLARTLVNTPSGHMGPQELVEVAQKIAARSKRISCEVLSQETMRDMGMGATLAVGQGSSKESQGVHLVYTPAKKAKKRIALIGKAVTFDSGGLSIKPADGMMTMKIDMAGSATVLGVFEALTQLAVDVEVHGIFLAVENMPSGNAYRPGDVITAMDGTSIEVLNTDAEGRLTLADALVYAQTFKPDAMIDLATLTGACVVALGEEVAGFFSNDTKLTQRLTRAATATGELIWELPLQASYKELIKSKIADIKNIGGRAGGAITAALFLERFVKQTPWIHMDIAGPAYTEKETRGDMPYGGTGFGVRTLLDLLRSF